MEKSKDSSVGALYMALPFTRGQAFIVSVLDAILSLVKSVRCMLHVFKALLTGLDSMSN